MVEEELLPFSCQPAADQPLCTQLHLPSPSFGGGGRSGGKGQMFAKLRKAFHHLQLKWPGSSLLPSSLPHVPAVTKAPVLPQALSIPWLHSTSLAWTTGGASLLSLCFHACPKLSLPHWPQSSPFTNANPTMSSSCLTPFVAPDNNSVSL